MVEPVPGIAVQYSTTNNNNTTGKSNGNNDVNKTEDFNQYEEYFDEEGADEHEEDDDYDNNGNNDGNVIASNLEERKKQGYKIQNFKLNGPCDEGLIVKVFAKKLIQIDPGIVFFATGNIAKKSNFNAFDRLNFESFKWNNKEDEIEFWNTKFDDIKDDYTMSFRVLTKKTTLELRERTFSYLKKHKAFMKSTEIDHSLNNNLGFMYGMIKGIHDKDHYEKAINNQIDKIMVDVLCGQPPEGFSPALLEKLKSIGDKYKKTESFHVKLLYMEYPARNNKVKADTIVIQGKSLHYNILQYILERIPDVCQPSNKIILKTHLNRLKFEDSCKLMTSHNDYVNNLQVMIINNLPDTYKQIEIGGKDDGMPAGSMKISLEKYFAALNIQSIEPTQHSDVKLLVFHSPTQNVETNLNQFFQTIGINLSHPLTQAAEKQYGNGKKVTIGPLMMRYDSTGYATGIDSFIHQIVLQTPQSTPRKSQHKVAEIDTTNFTQSTAKLNFLKAVQNTPSKRSNDTKESPASKASNFFNTPSAI